MVFKVSVIIPVYNAAAFVAKSVASALMQPETAEVILIEDGSTDNSLQVCRDIAEGNIKVRLYTHNEHANLGAGFSRNLGIKKAKYEYLAFLDADDVYLPDRFRAELKIFAEKPVTSGVYGALGFHYYSEAGRIKYQEKGFGVLTTITGKVPSNELFFVLTGVHPSIYGYFHVDTLTVKKSVLLEQAELFTGFAMHEDTVFFIQLSLNCKLEAGIIDEAIGLRGVHDHNRIVNNSLKSGSLITMWQYLYEWSLYAESGKPYSEMFKAHELKEKILLSGKATNLIKLLHYGFVHKKFIKQAVFFNPSCNHVFGKKIGSHVIKLKEILQCRLFKSDPNSFSTWVKQPGFRLDRNGE